MAKKGPSDKGAVCKVCRRYMLKSTGCELSPFQFKSKLWKQIPYGEEQHKGLKMQLGDAMAEEVLRFNPNPPRCPDCGAKKGFYHHAGCDQEECPKCHMQSIGCECWESAAKTLCT